VTGQILTFSTMTGTEQLAAVRSSAHPAAVAEAMEGYGVAWAAVQHGVPWAELRAISNRIGRRDRSTWNIPAAFASLARGIEALS
jgi:futalosine hydrolase